MNTLFQNACFYSKFIVYCLHQEGEIIMQKKQEHTHTPLDALTSFVQSQRTELQQLLSQFPKSKAIVGNLRIDRCRNSFQYYIVSERGDTKGKYISHKQIRKAAAIAQRDYNKATATILKKQIKAIDSFLAIYTPNAIDDAYTKLHPGRRALITPVREPDEDFIAAWRHLPYTGKPFEINAPEYYTASGVRVRSKSEVIIADALARANIPYRYEYPTSIKGWGTLYPDFTCLDIRTREEIIWEHFGLMSDPDYAENAVQKITHYAASGYVLGKNLIATFESGTTPLSIKQAQGCIDALFK